MTHDRGFASQVLIPPSQSESWSPSPTELGGPPLDDVCSSTRISVPVGEPYRFPGVTFCRQLLNGEGDIAGRICALRSRKYRGAGRVNLDYCNVTHCSEITYDFGLPRSAYTSVSKVKLSLVPLTVTTQTNLMTSMCTFRTAYESVPERQDQRSSRVISLPEPTSEQPLHRQVTFV